MTVSITTLKKLLHNDDKQKVIFIFNIYVMNYIEKIKILKYFILCAERKIDNLMFMSSTGVTGEPLCDIAKEYRNFCEHRIIENYELICDWEKQIIDIRKKQILKRFNGRKK